ncbi:GNAT family N-acetyltransferase [Mycobacteroides abscessus]|uniref:GNAT family N-acetyltransferase n=1 Tax=Mycobacteroides abscessus TaxID=36809 RepID=UPI0009A785CB|nr:GNAT family protein [Mycobacteroides abscessus]RIT44605.1 N-acetyltransferase [Mycobacteroides abscessus]SKT79032.1 putative acetyltransferase [Mycobacteroides abscessus subsp. massiliense]SKU02853.1 putative acetyltransferase [Mycobacteroides abscessus subsp. massiliense]
MAVAIHALADGHIPAIVDACADWIDLAQFGPPYWHPRSPAELRRKIAATAGPQPATEYGFVLADANDRLVGECSLHAIDWRNRLAQIGVCIWRPDDRRQGYGAVAVQHLVGWGFDYLAMLRLEAWIVEGNEPSIGLFSSLGFAHEATLRGRYFHAGKHSPMHVLSLTADRVAPA